jgi:DNA invertase Pin-like site-specific DNA recombinase
VSKQTQKTRTDSPATAYSYIRFSKKEQAKGDSLRRQKDNRDKWLDEHPDVTLDTSLDLLDDGRSGFKRDEESFATYALGRFVELVRTGKVPKGSYLLVENLDRLSREDEGTATELLLSLVNRGIVVVQLSPEVIEFRQPVNMLNLFRAVMELSRGHSESRMKSERVGAIWATKKTAAREGKPQPPRRIGGHISDAMTANCPRWLEERDGKLVPIPDRVRIVKRIFDMTANGYGAVSIAKKFKAEGVPSFGGRRAEWTRSYLALIIKDRRVLGEHQPMKNGKPDGDVIPNYYPAVVTEEEWLAARSGRQQRTATRGRRGKYINIFAGVLRSAMDRGPYYFTTWNLRDGKRKQHVLHNFKAVEGFAKSSSFPYDTLETCILSKLKELDPREILGDPSDGPDDLAVLSGEQAQNDTELAALAADMEANGFSQTLSNRIRTLEARRTELAQKIVDARQRASSPASEAWGELKALCDIIATAADKSDVRLRIQAALRRIVTEGWMIVAKRGNVRLARVSLYFGEGEDAPFRSFLILHRPMSRSRGVLQRNAQTAIRMIKHPDDRLPFNKEDMRTDDGAVMIQGDLESYPVRMIEQLLSEG